MNQSCVESQHSTKERRRRRGRAARGHAAYNGPRGKYPPLPLRGGESAFAKAMARQAFLSVSFNDSFYWTRGSGRGIAESMKAFWIGEDGNTPHPNPLPNTTTASRPTRLPPRGEGTCLRIRRDTCTTGSRPTIRRRHGDRAPWLQGDPPSPGVGARGGPNDEI